MQFFQALSAILDNNWSVIDQKKQMFSFKLSERNKLSGDKLFLKPRYYSMVAAKYLPKPRGTTTPEYPDNFSVLFVNVKSHVKAFVYTEELKRQKEKKLPVQSPEPTFLTIIAAFSTSDWSKVPKSINILTSTEEYWDPAVNTLGVLKNSNAQEIVYGALGQEKDYSLEIREPSVHNADGAEPNIPKILMGYKAKLGKRVGILKTGVTVSTDATTTTSATTVTTPEGVTHVFTKTTEGDRTTFSIDGKEVSSPEVSRIAGELVLKKWIVE